MWTVSMWDSCWSIQTSDAGAINMLTVPLWDSSWSAESSDDEAIIMLTVSFWDSCWRNETSDAETINMLMVSSPVLVLVLGLMDCAWLFVVLTGTFAHAGLKRNASNIHLLNKSGWGYNSNYIISLFLSRRMPRGPGVKIKVVQTSETFAAHGCQRSLHTSSTQMQILLSSHSWAVLPTSSKELNAPRCLLSSLSKRYSWIITMRLCNMNL